MYLKISAMNEYFNPKVGLRALFSGPHWLAPYHTLVHGGEGDIIISRLASHIIKTVSREIGA
jgi:hypothetical protein